jgi:hypothetical protein
MALFYECMLQYAQKVLDAADIVRHGDVTPPANSAQFSGLSRHTSTTLTNHFPEGRVWTARRITSLCRGSEEIPCFHVVTAALISLSGSGVLELLSTGALFPAVISNQHLAVPISGCNRT